LKKPSELKVRLETGADTTALVYPAAEAKETLILAHGAGAGQRSTFMVAAANALSSLGIDVLTFNFQYTEQRRRIPDRAPVLEACYLAVIDVARREIESARRSLFIGGKSMGGRIATQVAAANQQLPIAGLVLLGYPLHPPGRPEQRRDKHLPSCRRSSRRSRRWTRGRKSTSSKAGIIRSRCRAEMRSGRPPPKMISTGPSPGG
jgi:uncharacterized protein